MILGSKESAYTHLGKLPPQAIEMEEAVLGAVMLERDAVSTALEILRPDHFYSDKHKDIFQAILDLTLDSEPVDMRTVANQLKKSGKIESSGGNYYIAELTSKVSSAANLESHARIIKQQFIKREIIRVASEMHHEAYDDSTDPFLLLEALSIQLSDISQDNLGNSFVDMRTLLLLSIEDIERRKKQEGGLTGVPSGFSDLDKITGGWQNTDLIIIAARPGMGKSTFIVTSARNVAIGFGIPVAIFSLEMSADQITKRLISSESEINGERLRKGNVQESDMHKILNKTSSLADAPIFIDDTPALSILDLYAKARKIAREKEVKLIMIDYLQLMNGADGNNSRRTGNRDQEIGRITRSLKALAKELNIPVIALSQLSRAVETRGGDRKPILADLRESGSIEQEADMVIFLYRAEYYGITEDADGNSLIGIAEAIIAKHRGGSLDSVPLKFIGKYTKFLDVDYTEEFKGQQTIESYESKIQKLTPMSDIPPDEEEDDDLPF